MPSSPRISAAPIRRLERSSQSCPASQAQAVQGQQLPYTPRFKGNLTARYTFPIMGWTGHIQGSVFYQTMAFAALRTADNADLGDMPGYASADFSVGAEHNNMTLEVFIKNAFDSRGEVNRSTPCTISTCAPGYPAVGALPPVPPAVYVSTIQPLTVGIKIGQKFEPGESRASVLG